MKNIVSDSKRKQYIERTTEYLNYLIKTGIYTDSICSILNSLIEQINSLKSRKIKKDLLEKLEKLTIKYKKYEGYKTDHRSFRILENQLEYEKLENEGSNEMYNYVFNMLVKERALIFMDNIFKKYPRYLYVCDDDCNSLLYNLVVYYLNKGDDYHLTCINYYLEKTPNVEKEEIIKIRKMIIDNKNSGIIAVKTRNLEKVLESYFPYSPKQKQTSVKESYIKRNNFGGETFIHEKILTPGDYKDRVDLLDSYSFGITNSSLVENAYSINKTANGRYEIFHHIADVSCFLKRNSKMEKSAEKQLFLMPHKNHTDSLFHPDFLKSYVSLNEMSEKLAITVKHEFSEDGKYLRSDVFRSAIYIGTVYRKSQVDLLIKENGNRNLVKLYNLLKSNSKKSPSNTIISQINDLTAKYLEEYLNKQRIPKIYESTFYLSDTDALNIITKYTDKTFEHASFLDFLALFKEVTDRQVQYTVEDIGDTILKIDTPFRTYLDYRNLKIIDYILKYKKMSRGEKYLLKDELRDLSTRASAVKLATKTKK